MLHVIATLNTLAQADISPDEIQRVIDLIMSAVTSAQSMKWVTLSIVVVQLVVFVVKRVKTKFVKKYGGLVVLVSSALMSVLSLVDGGNTWKQALLVFAASGASKFIHDLLHMTGVLKHKDESEDPATEGQDSE